MKKIFQSKRIVFLLLSIILVVVIVIGTTYSVFFKADALNNTLSYTSGILEISSLGGSVLSLNNALPMSDEDGSNSTPYTFTLTNTGNLPYKFNIKLLTTTVANIINTQYIKVMLDDMEPVLLSTSSTIASNITLLPEETMTLTIRIWLTLATPNTEIGKTFNCNVVTEGQAINLELPNDYTRVEYLESTGTQYIDTGYIMTSDSERVYIDFEKTDVSNNTSLFGSEYPTVGTNRTFTLIVHGTSSVGIYCGSGSNGSITTTQGIRYKLDLIAINKSIIATYTNVSTGMTTNPAINNYSFPINASNEEQGFTAIPYSIFLFANHTNSGSNFQHTIAKIYQFRLYDNNVLVRYMIPSIRNIDNVAGMYDTVNNVFYTNAGTGTFVVPTE